MWIRLSSPSHVFTTLDSERRLKTSAPSSTEFELINVSYPNSTEIAVGDKFLMRTANGNFVRADLEAGLIADIDLLRIDNNNSEEIQRNMPSVFRLIATQDSRLHDRTFPFEIDAGVKFGIEYIRYIPPDNTWRDFLTAFFLFHGVAVNPTPLGLLDGGAFVAVAQYAAGPAGASQELYNVLVDSEGHLSLRLRRRSEPGDTFIFYPVRHKIHIALPGYGLVAAQDGEGQLRGNSPNRGSWETFNLIVKKRNGRSPSSSIRHEDEIQIQGANGGWVWATHGGGGPLAANNHGTSPPLYIEKVGAESGSGELIQNDDLIRFKTGSNWYVRADSGSGSSLIANTAIEEEASVFRIEMERKLYLYRDDRGESFSASSYESLVKATDDSYRLVGEQCYILVGPRVGAVPICQFFNEARNAHALASTEKTKRELTNKGYRFLGTEGFVYNSPHNDTIPIRMYKKDPIDFTFNPFNPNRTRSSRQDYLTISQINDERWSAENDYAFLRLEGYGRGIISIQQPDITIDIDNIEDLSADNNLTILAGSSHLPDGDLSDHAISIGDDNQEVATRTSRSWVRGGPAPAVRINGRIRDGLAFNQHGSLDIEHTQRVDFGLPRLPPDMRTRRIDHALVLSGGGAKGAFEVGAALRLWEEGYRPDLICGVSVGALNGSVLAEEETADAPNAAQRLESIWRSIGDGPNSQQIYEPNYYLDRLQERIEGRGLEVLLRLGAVPFTFGTSLIGANLDGLDQEAFKLIQAVHSIHSMRPLRSLIERELRPQSLRNSGIGLRLGITDGRTGRYISVSSADPLWSEDMADYGRLEIEPDHGVGTDWLSRPLFGSDGYIMKIKDAVYCSSVMPVFMEPMLTRLGECRVRSSGEERLAELKFNLPSAVAQLLSFSDAELDQLAEDFGPDSSSHHFFDGGLRDAIPIRTAMRLGARNITVISGDVLHSSVWSSASLRPSGLQAPPAFDYLLRLVGIWSNDSSRNDLMLGIGMNELLGKLYYCYNNLDGDARGKVEQQLDKHWAELGKTLRENMGASTPIGGIQPFRALRDAAIGPDHYGAPLHDEGCNISLINPDRPILDSLAFHDRRGIREAIDLGYERAKEPVRLSLSGDSIESR